MPGEADTHRHRLAAFNEGSLSATGYGGLGAFHPSRAHMDANFEQYTPSIATVGAP
jgi:hypothetical protein